MDHASKRATCSDPSPKARSEATLQHPHSLYDSKEAE